MTYDVYGRGHRVVGPQALRDFSRHFSSPNIPKPPPPPPPPAPDGKAIQEAESKERGRLARRKGRGSTLLSGDTLGSGGTLGGPSA